MPELPPFNQAAIDACANLSLSNAADILAALNAKSFYAWYNAQFKGVAEVSDRCPSEDTPAKHNAFVTFWDQIGTIFGRGSITGLEFCALMGINLQEARGKLSGVTEGVNKITTKPHPGIAYAFDAIPGLKASYNNGGSNRTALDLFGDPLFRQAHGAKSGAAAVLNRPGGIDPKWGGDTWPANVPADEDANKNGFIMEADFYKFRGRGVIQTTWRSTYQDVIKWILDSGAAANPALAAVAARWQGAVGNIPPAQQVSAIATISTNADWNTVFMQPITLAKGIAIFSASKADFLNGLKKDAATLDHPDRKIKGSFRFFASRINGGAYPEHVAPKMKALVRGLAQAQLRKPQPAGVPIS